MYTLIVKNTITNLIKNRKKIKTGDCKKDFFLKKCQNGYFMSVFLPFSA